MEQKALNILIVGFAVNEALTDAALHVGKIEKEKRNEVEQRVFGYIEEIYGGYYDTYETIKQISLKSMVNFGVVQKIVNMTAKYMFISCYDNEQLRKKFTNCHCPMDKTMIKKVIETYRKLITAGEIKKDEEEYLFYHDFKHKNKRSSEWSNLSWSNISLDEIVKFQDNPYIRFQQMVKVLAEKEKLSPLEYDFKYFE